MTDNNNSPTIIQRYVALWPEICKPDAWASAAYFVIWYLPWTFICMSWVLFTGAISVASLLFPPLGYFICIGTVISWRYCTVCKLLITRNLFYILFNHNFIDLWRGLI